MEQAKVSFASTFFRRYLPLVLMASKQLIPVAGLQLMVYGLEEYKALDTQGPVAVMFALHGRLGK